MNLLAPVWGLVVVGAPCLAEASAAQASSHFQHGLSLKREGKLPAAAAELERALALDPTHVLAHWALAWTCATLKRTAEAANHFRQVIALEPNGERATEAAKALGRLGVAAPPGARHPLPVLIASAEEALERCAAAYAGIDRLTARGTFTQHFEGEHSFRHVMPVTLAYQRPSKFRVELHEPTHGHTLACDGRLLWVYLPILKEYTKTAAPKSLGAMGGGMVDDLVGPFLPLPMQLLASEDPLKTLQRGASEATLVGEETLQLGDPSTDIRTYHLSLTTDEGPLVGRSEADAAPVVDLWIDVATLLIRKYSGGVDPVAVRANPRYSAWGEGTLSVVETYHTLVVDRPVSQTLFAFEPPNGDIREVETFGPPDGQVAGKGLGGKLASPFSLPSFGGGQHALSDFRGRPLIICFWRADAPGVRALLPLLDALARKHEEDRLGVLGIVADGTGAARGLAEKLALGHPTLYDRDAEVTREYGAFIQPMLVCVDRLGFVREVLRQAGDEGQIRQALGSLGLQPKA